jgi:hypothetical protein
MEVTSLYRWMEFPEDRTLITDRWDEGTEDWIDDPSLLDVTGLGGPAGFIEVEENAAKELVGTWRRRKGRLPKS